MTISCWLISKGRYPVFVSSRSTFTNNAVTCMTTGRYNTRLDRQLRFN